MFFYFLLFGKLFIYLLKRKKTLVTVSIVYFFSNLIITNFDNLRYKTKYDGRGGIYIHDLLTGKKWKRIPIL